MVHFALPEPNPHTSLLLITRIVKESCAPFDQLLLAGVAPIVIQYMEAFVDTFFHDIVVAF